MYDEVASFNIGDRVIWDVAEGFAEAGRIVEYNGVTSTYTVELDSGTTVSHVYEGNLRYHPVEPLDVWLRIPEGEEDAEAEANTFPVRGGGFYVGWYLTAVGLVKRSQWFPTYDEARAWLTSEGFSDFTS